jgi:hypothetical protein
MAAVTFTVVLPQGQAVPYYEVSLLALAKKLLLDYPDFRHQPLALQDHRYGNILYYNSHAFGQYLAGKMPMQQLIACSWCHGLYRNRAKLLAAGGAEVEEGSLWLQRDQKLILLDDDNYIEGNLNTAPQLFDKIV